MAALHFCSFAAHCIYIGELHSCTKHARTDRSIYPAPLCNSHSTLRTPLAQSMQPHLQPMLPTLAVPCFWATLCPEDHICGTYVNACGQTLDCGTCPAGKVCSLNGTQCVDKRPACSPAKECPKSRVCGFYPDGCELLATSWAC
jgi:hypothetical protein